MREAAPEFPHLNVSARNRFPGIVTRVEKDGVMALVEIQAGPHRVISLMSREAAEDLGLEPGVRAAASIKATNVVVDIDVNRAWSSPWLWSFRSHCRCVHEQRRRPDDHHRLRRRLLTDAFTEIGEEFVKRNPGIDVRFNFAGSSTLAEQINAGAPVDVFAGSFDHRHESSSRCPGRTRFFAANSLAIAVPLGNPANMRHSADLTDPNVTIVICNAPVPCGEAAEHIREERTARHSIELGTRCSRRTHQGDR